MNKLISSILMFTLTVSGQEYGVDFNNDGRLDRSEFYWAFPNQDLYEGFARLDLNKDGFIDQVEQERATRVQEMTESVRANLQRLENMSKAGLTEQQLESIFGVSSRSSSCPFGSGFLCLPRLGGSILKCVPEAILKGASGVVNCVRGIIGAADSCLGCVCWVMSTVSSVTC